DDIRFHLVAVHVRSGEGMVDRIEQGEQRGGVVAVTQYRECNDRPQGGMRVLAAIFADTWWVAFDVAGIVRCLIEWRREQQRQLFVGPDQFALDRRHGLGRARAVARPRDQSPGLRDRIDPAFGVGCRPKWGAVVEPGAAVPVAIPGLLLERGS